MKYVLATAMLAALLVAPAFAEPPACKDQSSEKDAQAAPKKAPGKTRAARPAEAMTPADKEILDRAHTRTLLENIESDLRRQRLGR